MGTNYYVGDPKAPCPTCGRGGDERLHIGKKSCGWKFIFHAHHELQTFQQWRAHLEKPGITIVGEDDDCPMPVSEFLAMVVANQDQRTHRGDNRAFIDAEGYEFLPCDFC